MGKKMIQITTKTKNDFTIVEYFELMNRTKKSYFKTQYKTDNKNKPAAARSASHAANSACDVALYIWQSKIKQKKEVYRNCYFIFHVGYFIVL